MSNILHEMKPTLMKYSDIITRVIGAPVSIFDSEENRLTYGGKLDASNVVLNGNIGRTTLRTGEVQVMLEPFGHPGCKDCHYRDQCPDIVQIWVPILLHENVIGAITLNPETLQQMKKILRNHKSYLLFLKQIAGFISTEADQTTAIQRNETLLRLLETVIDQIDSGVMVLDRNYKILRLNKAGMQLLHSHFPELRSRIISLEPTGEKIDSQSEYLISDGITQYAVVGNLYHIDMDIYSEVFIFSASNAAKNWVGQKSLYKSIIGTSPEIQAVRTQVLNAGNSSSCVLISAENGLQTELFARAIHNESGRRSQPFVRVDCAAMAEQDLLEYLFGSVTISNVAGSRGKPGRIEAASGGTLYLDDISALPRSAQKKLIPLVERKAILRGGSKKERRVDVRVIASTKENLHQVCKKGLFDQELYYLINVIHIRIPPLRSRREDIRPLAAYYIRFYAEELDKSIQNIEDAFWDRVVSYDWPGNIQELRSAMEYVINMVAYPQEIRADLLPARVVSSVESQLPPTFNLEEAERAIIRRALAYRREKHVSNEDLARMLGVGAATLYRKIKKYGFDD